MHTFVLTMFVFFTFMSFIRLIFVGFDNKKNQGIMVVDFMWSLAVSIWSAFLLWA